MVCPTLGTTDTSTTDRITVSVFFLNLKNIVRLTQIGTTNITDTSVELDGDIMDSLVLHIIDIVEARGVQRAWVAGGSSLHRRGEAGPQEGVKENRNQMHDLFRSE